MNNIINLIKKEFLTLNLLQSRNLLMSIISIAFSIFLPEFIILPYYLLTTLVIINPFYTDEASKGEYLTYSLPINNKEYILSKYIFCLLSIFAISLIISLGSFIGNFIGKPPIFPIFSLFLVGIGISLFMVSITVPLIIKFGYKNISLINTMIMLSITFSVNFLISNLSQIASINGNTLALILSLLSILIFFISILISIFITRKKEVLN